jgi:chromosome segregation ATPase
VTLAGILERLEMVLSSYQASVGEQVALIGQAVRTLADPDAVAASIAAAKAAAGAAVAKADDIVAAERHARSVAEAAARTAELQRADAEQAAIAAWERVETLETELQAAETGFAAFKADTARQIAGLRAAVDAATAAEAALRNELQVRQAAHDQQQARLQGELDAIKAGVNTGTETSSKGDLPGPFDQLAEQIARLQTQVARLQPTPTPKPTSTPKPPVPAPTSPGGASQPASTARKTQTPARTPARIPARGTRTTRNSRKDKP